MDSYNKKCIFSHPEPRLLKIKQNGKIGSVEFLNENRLKWAINPFQTFIPLVWMDCHPPFFNESSMRSFHLW